MGKTTFRNCLVAMWPTSILLDLPSTHDVSTHLHNEFVSWMGNLKAEIKVLNGFHGIEQRTDTLVKIKEAPGLVSTTSDSWTVDTTKEAFLGVTAHWIDIRDGKWKVRAEVIGFQLILGDHSGENLG